jgi:hypothetical protein
MPFVVMAGLCHTQRRATALAVLSEPNPYAPPKSDVNLPSRRPAERPREIVAAVRLMWLSLILVVPTSPYDLQTRPWLGWVADIVLLGVIYAVSILIIVKINRGRNWARITALVLALMGVMGALIVTTTAPSEPVWYLALSLVSMVVNGIGVYLTFRPPGSSWFRQ